MDTMEEHAITTINKQPALKAHSEDNRVDVGDPQVWRTRKTYINGKEVLAFGRKIKT